ncbi:DUF4012 domain-containing protein [Arthrobacter sp. SAFR-179]|uniref:DUF4012 domain-containing protein n=1 Tax=Arthrobacter sp. SAFR-179 TaxID=3387279 RepID=UPI003F7BE962
MIAAKSKEHMEATNSPQRKSLEKLRKGGPERRKLTVKIFVAAATMIMVGALAGFWLTYKANVIKSELEPVVPLASELKSSLLDRDSLRASGFVQAMTQHTAAAREAAEDPLWTLASGLPGLGLNLRAVTEVARSADDVTNLGLVPLVHVYESLNWDSLMPSSSGSSLEPIKAAAPTLASSTYAIRISSDRLEAIDASQLLDEIAKPLKDVRGELRQASETLTSASDAASITPRMLGAEAPRNYLVMIQNNAEARASGGIPGALAVLTLDNGKLELGKQSSASDVGIMAPTLPVDPQQQQIYSTRLGKYIQDVNLTPDFPTAASTVRAMWEQKTGQRVDGVLSIDPIVLSYILKATGPVPMNGPELASVKAAGLPTELTGNNVVPTLLSDVYAKIRQPELQDAYFAGVAKEIFSALSSGKGEAKGLITGITQGAQEGRVLVWSADSSEQSVISKYPLSGSVSGPSVSPAQFGVYFNDGTGAKMDYYVKRRVQLVKECPADGYEHTTVRVTSTNTAPANAEKALPPYVTGGGAFGVAPGTVQTNIIAYGPVQANVESAMIDGQKIPFAPYLHANRPVGVVAQQLAPGESKTVDFRFGKIVQHTEPDLVVTPTVQPVKEVTLPTKNAPCG